MDPLTAARAQMEVSLGFHMVFAALGIGMPVLMLAAEGLALRTGKPHYRLLARTWGKATALLFAIGAVSGTALSFELGLLWPRFMRVAGPVIGPAFVLEGYAFFVEAIFVGLYLYGWDRLSPRAHFLAGIPVALSGLASGAIVVAANAWMQHPVGFTLTDGVPTQIDPSAVFTNPYWFPMAIHSSLSCYIATGFAAAGVYAFGWLRGRRGDYQRAALGIALVMGMIGAVAQVPSGHLTAQNTAHLQPVKLAAFESHFHTARDVPVIIGGIPDPAGATLRYAIRVPYGLSILAADDPHATVRGLTDWPRDRWPNVWICHVAFQVMVGCGFALLGLAAWFGYARWRRRQWDSPWLMRAIALCSPLGMVALEAGWMVSEAGRQPWVIADVMRTRDAVTQSPSVPVAFVAFTVLYLVLGVTLVALLRYLARGHDVTTPPRDVPALATERS